MFMTTGQKQQACLTWQRFARNATTDMTRRCATKTAKQDWLEMKYKDRIIEVM
jgi:hypothetical protein